MYHAHSPLQAFTIRGSIADDLRFKMALEKDGRPLIQYVVSDDALAVRFVDKGFGGRLANELGHPTVDTALRDGAWVVDPSGAPPLVQRETGPSVETTGDPFRDAREVLRYVTRSMAQSPAVAEFSLQNITYRPAFDPWRYPVEDSGEIRYDLARAALATAEQPGATDAVSSAQFRKMVVFVKRGRVEQVCSTVDIEGHEEFVTLKERGMNSNPYLRDLLAHPEGGNRDADRPARRRGRRRVSGEGGRRPSGGSRRRQARDVPVSVRAGRDRRGAAAGGRSADQGVSPHREEDLLSAQR